MAPSYIRLLDHASQSVLSKSVQVIQHYSSVIASKRNAEEGSPCENYSDRTLPARLIIFTPLFPKSAGKIIEKSSWRRSALDIFSYSS